MLNELHLKNFVIVKDLSLNWGEGFSALTGETGAGKSILIDAIGLVLGNRAEARYVMQGSKQTEICAIFSSNPSAEALLEEWSIEKNLDNEILLRRVIDNEGHSRIFINSVPCTLNQVKTLSECLIDIHGQFEHQSLLKAENQLVLLDNFADNHLLLKKVQETFTQWENAKKRLLEALEKQNSIQERKDLLQSYYQDLAVINPQKGMWETLNETHTRLSKSHDIMQCIEFIRENLNGENNSNLLSSLSQCSQKLSQASEFDPKLTNQAQQLENAQNIIEEVTRDIDRYNIDDNEAQFEEIDNQITLFFNLARQFHEKPEDLWQRYENIKNELAQLNEQTNIEDLKKEVNLTQKEYEKVSQNLQDRREQAANTLSKEVTLHMQNLSMPGSTFEIRLSKTAPSKTGGQNAEFYVSSHAGACPQPLIKVVSGGELSRITLALAVVVAKICPVSTLIFDEIDSGIGGAVAEVVGRLMRTLASSRQVLCVTHLPQVASFAHHHLYVKKQTLQGQTISTLTTLNDKERVEEIARMLAGVDVGEAARKNAIEMLHVAQTS